MKDTHQKETRTIIKVIFAWQDEKEEKWLEEMAAKGWRLEAVIPYVYTFRRSQPEKVVYRLDYKSTLDKDYQEYLSLFKDAGWELLTTFAGWHYFRINPHNDTIPEIYNSDRAKAQKYRRLLYGLMPVSVLLIYSTVQLIDRTVHTEHLLTRLAFDSIFWIVLLFFIYAILRVWLKIRKLESRQGE